jgi:hypothetical protein
MRNAAPRRAYNLRLEIARQTRYSRSEGRTTEDRGRKESGSDLSVVRRPFSVVISHGDLHVAHDRPNPNEAQGSGQIEPGQILTFQLRRRVGPPRRAPIAPDGAEPVDDLATFEDEDGHIDYRHRMLMNVIAVLIVSLLISAGVWIADTIAAMQKAQDCALQGRQNCAPIEVPVTKK